MLRWGILPSAVVAAAFVAAPVYAQSDQSEGSYVDEPFVPAFNSDSDLDCAIFIGALMADTEEEMTPDNRMGLTSAFTYFVGRYEAQRGIRIKEAFTARYPIYLELNPVEIQQTCSVRMRAFGARLQDAGSALERLAPRRAPDTGGSEAESEQSPVE